MALMECSIFSEALGMCANVHVIVPQPTLGQIGLKGVGKPDGCPVLYLLHGHSDDHSIWLRRTSIERYASQFGIAVVMPNCHRSWYADIPNGLRYWEYVSVELPKLINGFFRFSQKREDTFVAGLSMGGYGAYKMALNLPERFAAAGCFSSAITPWKFGSIDPGKDMELKSIYGAKFEAGYGTLNDIYAVAEKQVAAKKELPRLFVACGTEDFLYEENRLFNAHLTKLGIPYELREEPGTHEWGFWDRQILEFLKWLKAENLLK